MGEVWLATRRGARGGTEQVALKRIKDAKTADPKTLRQFEHEVKISSLLQHPNVVKVIEHGHDSDGPYLTLEFIDGVSLRRLLLHAKHHGHPVPEIPALAIIRDSARALHYAHRFSHPTERLRGVVHRDVSPDNLLVAYAGISKLVDFGLATTLEGLPRLRTAVKGKYPYFAPELFTGSKASPATDRFAFAATCCELLTGVTPYRGNDGDELLDAVKRGECLSLAALRPGLDPEVATWIHAGVSRDPLLRPSLEALIGLLNRLLGPDPVARAQVAQYLAEHRDPLSQPLPLSVPPTFAIPHPRRPAGWGPVLATAAVVLALLGAGVALWIHHEAATAKLTAPHARAAQPSERAAPNGASLPQG